MLFQGRFWKAYAQLEMDRHDWDATKKIFERCLMQVREGHLRAHENEPHVPRP